MSLNSLRNVKRTLWYSTIFILSSVLLFAVTYYFFSSTILKQNHEAILSEVNEITAEYITSGMASLEKEMDIIKKSRKKQPFFIRLAGTANNTLQVFFPYQWTEFDLKKLEDIKLDEKKWISLPSRDEEYFLEVNSTRLLDGNWLQVGLSTEDRHKVLERFREIFMSVIILMALLGFMLGILLAFRALRPLQHLVRTVQSISSGKMESRVSRTGAGDELDDLSRPFNEMLEKIETLIGALKGSLDNVAHDLRTPMTRFRNKAETALQIRGDEERYREALADCLEESERILRMLNTLMDISEAETGIMRLDKRKTNIKNLLENVGDLYHYVAEENNLSINQKTHEDLHAMVDPDRMGQALANLLDNAVKYTPSGGQISLEAIKQDQEIIIHVKDTGTGIPVESLPRIWDRLYRADPSRPKTGLGLGLAQVKAIIEAHNSRIEVASEHEKGSVFSIHLPTGQ
jgi:signal transduction histidine kinase